MTLSQRSFGAMGDGQAIDLYTLARPGGIAVDIMTYGAIIVGLRAPDRAGRLTDVTLGFDSLDAYLQGHPYFGAVVGRYANRIARGVFALDGQSYALARNNGPNHLHGGVVGFDKRVWSGQTAANDDALTLALTSADGDEGYPGTLDVTVTYRLTDDASLQLDYRATTDRPTIVNLSNHTYFNLAGQGDVLDHEVRLAASHFLPIDASLIPTGERRPVAGTLMDFTVAKQIGAQLPSDDEQIQRANGGYDHCWLLDQTTGDLTLAATLREPTSGRRLDVLTTQPAVQFYTGNFLDGSLTGRGGEVYRKHAGFCLETQHFPDSPNQPGFPSTVLRPGEVFEQTTIFRLTVE